MSSIHATPASLGKYQIRAVLGRGAMGTVYDGWDPVIGRRVAIKTVRLLDNHDPEAQEGLARFKNEAQAAGRLSHPNIVAVYDYGEVEETAYIVMEFIAGQTLKEQLAAKQRFPVAETVRIMEQVLAGLQFSHDKGVIHRDIKPGNVMMTADGHAKLADFGIARIESSVMTQAGTMIGTPAYMSPEQLMAQAVDARTDIYSAGVLLYQLLTGERPFEGGLTAIIHKALNTTPPRPSEISVSAPPALDAIVAQAMARRPDDRFPNAASFARALRAAFATPESGLATLGLGLDDEATMVAASTRTTVKPTIAPPAARAARTRRGLNPALLGGAAVVLLGLTSGGTWFALRRSPAGPVQVAVAPPATLAQSAPHEPPGTAAAVRPTRPAVPPARPVAATKPADAAGSATAPAVNLAVPASSPAADRKQAETTPPVSAAASASAENALPVAVETPLPVAPPPLPSASSASPPKRVALVTPNATSVREALRAIAGSARCALPRFSVAEDGRISVSGLTGTGAPDIALRDAVWTAAPGAALTWDTRTVDGPYCDVIDAIRPIALADSPLVILGLKNGATRLKAHDFILPIVTMPDFPAYLQVDYFSHDGTVAHLYPVNGTPDPLFGRYAIVKLGLDRRGKPDLEVGPPFGIDLIVALASSDPLFAGRGREDETVQTYLPALKAAIEAAQQRGANLTARALVVETVKQ